MQTANRNQEVKHAIDNSHRLDMALDLLIDYLMRVQDDGSERAAAEHEHQEQGDNLDASAVLHADGMAYSALSSPSPRVRGGSKTPSKSARRNRRPLPDLSL